jgi:hypothetical protein
MPRWGLKAFTPLILLYGGTAHLHAQTALLSTETRAEQQNATADEACVIVAPARSCKPSTSPADSSSLYRLRQPTTPTKAERPAYAPVGGRGIVANLSPKNEASSCPSTLTGLVYGIYPDVWTTAAPPTQPPCYVGAWSSSYPVPFGDSPDTWTLNADSTGTVNFNGRLAPFGCQNIWPVTVTTTSGGFTATATKSGRWILRAYILRCHVVWYIHYHNNTNNPAAGRRQCAIHRDSYCIGRHRTIYLVPRGRNVLAAGIQPRFDDG